MSLDISRILEGWPYEPGRISARKIKGSDGQEKIQLRLDVGLLQMNVTGRPDGQHPHGHESLLNHYEHELKKYIKKHGSDKGFGLDEQACELLRTEALMYYHRYLAEFILEDFKAVERDTARNLRLMDFCIAYAIEESDMHVLEQYRPYVLMMWARGRGRAALRDNRPKAALAAVRKGIKQIEAVYNRFGQEDSLASSGEIAILDAMVKDIEAKIPPDPMQRLRKELDKAIEEERYEDAAIIRDRLRRATRSGPALPGDVWPSKP